MWRLCEMIGTVYQGKIGWHQKGCHLILYLTGSFSDDRCDPRPGTLYSYGFYAIFSKSKGCKK